MTLLDIVSKVSGDDRISVVDHANDEFLIDASPAERLMDSHRFHTELAGREVVGLSVGVFCDLVIRIAN